MYVTKNSNADNDYWDEYKRHGRDFRGAPEDLEELIIEESRNVRIHRKRDRDNNRSRMREE